MRAQCAAAVAIFALVVANFQAEAQTASSIIQARLESGPNSAALGSASDQASTPTSDSAATLQSSPVNLDPPPAVETETAPTVSNTAPQPDGSPPSSESNANASEPTLTPIPPSAPTESFIAPPPSPPAIESRSGADSGTANSGNVAPNALRTTTNTQTPDDTTPSLANASGKNTTTKRPTTTKRQTTTPPPATTSSGSSSGLSDNGGSDYLDPTLSYACVCKDVRKVSLMSASDYCLSPAAVISNKCGNPVVAEKGECPVAGAQPCQDTGHVLSNDSVCAYDKRDDTYKCVASKEDLYIQKYGKKRKPLNSTSSPSGGTSAAPQTAAGQPVLQVVMLVASLLVGLSAVA